MKSWLIFSAGVLMAAAVHAAPVEWLTDDKAALDRAKAENKAVMMFFTGSDWSPDCEQMQTNIFETPKFAAFASNSLVLVKVDFPRTATQTVEQRDADSAMVRRFSVGGYPTIVFLNGAGDELGRLGNVEGGPADFIAEAGKIPGIQREESDANATNSALEITRGPSTEPVVLVKSELPKVKYDDLVLKGLALTKNGRTALINNETLKAGDTAKVKVKDGYVEVVCKEIRNDSVLVTVDGKEAELKLGEPYGAPRKVLINVN